jgi:hypothetical protein
MYDHHAWLYYILLKHNCLLIYLRAKQIHFNQYLKKDKIYSAQPLLSLASSPLSQLCMVTMVKVKLQSQEEETGCLRPSFLSIV